MPTDDELFAEIAACNGDADKLAALMARWDAEDAERERRLNAPDALANAAAWYAGQGLRVFPVEVGGKRPLGRLAPHGCKDATADTDKVRAWWSAEPQANIGIATGHLVDVIDIDGPVGYRSIAPHWQMLVAESVGVVSTGSGGAHIYLPADERRKNSVSAHLKGVDTRATGGYVVAPPSRHASGRLYAWSTPLNLAVSV